MRTIKYFLVAVKINCAAALVTTERDRLMVLLSELDVQQKLPNELGSFMEDQRRGWWAVSREPPRRRGGHPPCECPDNPGDMYTTGCLNRRMGLVETQLSAVQTPNQTLGFSVSGGIGGLRNEYINDLMPYFKEVSTDTANVTKQLSDRGSGYIYRVDRATQKLLNEETMMLYSLNQAWMSAVNMSNTVGAGANGLQSLMNTVTGDMIRWFNGMQGVEESVNFGNLNQAAALANGALSTYSKSLNEAQSVVFGLLSGLDSSIGGLSRSSSSLADSLDSAADSLANQIQSFNQSLRDMGNPTSQSIQQGLAGLVSQYQGVSQKQIGNLETAAATKITQTRSATVQDINNQRSTQGAALGVARTQGVAKIGLVASSQGNLSWAVQSAFQNLTDSIDTDSQKDTASINDQVTSITGNISTVNSSVGLVQGEVVSFVNKVKTTVSSTRTDVQGFSSGAQKALTALKAQATSKASQVVSSANSLAAGSIQAVGTNFHKNMNQLGLNTDSLISSLSSAASTTAQQSASAAAGLSSAANAGHETVGVAKDTVSGAVRDALESMLGSVETIPTRIQSTAAVGASLVKSLSDSQTNVSNAVSQVTSLAADGLASSATNLTNIEKQVGSLLSGIKQGKRTGASKVKGISSATGALSRAGKKTQSSVQKSAAKSKTSLVDAADLLANSEDSASQQLSRVVGEMMNTANGSSSSASISGSLTSTLNSATDLLGSAQAAAKNALETVSGSSQSGVAALAAAQQKTAAVSSTAKTNFQDSSTKLSQSTNSAMSDIDDFLASATNGVAGVVAKQLSVINSMKSSTSSQVENLKSTQLVQIQALAASIDSLMQQVNAFLGKNVGPLASQVQQLEVDAKRLLLQLNALQIEGERIDAAATTTGGYGWRDIVSSISGILLHQNSSAFDQLVQVGSGFNRSADSLAAQAVAQIQEVESNYTNQVNQLESQLSAASSVASSTSAENSTQISQSLVSLVRNLSNSVANLSSASNAALSDIKNTASNGLPPNMASLYGLVAKGAQAAAVDAQYAEFVLDDLAAQAQKVVGSISQFNQTNGTLNPADVSQEESLAAMNENVAKAKLQEQQSFLKSLSGASTNLSADYEAQVQAGRMAASLNASNLQNQILQGKAALANMVGSVAEEYASQQSKMGADASVSRIQQSIDLASMRRTLVSLLESLDILVGSASTSFGIGASDMDSFSSTVLNELQRNMSAFGQTSMNDITSINNNISEIGSTLYGVRVTPLDSQLNSQTQEFNDWVSDRVSQIEKTNSSIYQFGETIPIEESLVKSKTEAALFSVASAARTLLAHFNINIPQIDEIVARKGQRI